MERVQALFGLFGMVLICWALSVDRKAVRWRVVVWGVALQLAFAAIILLPDIGQDVFAAVDKAVKTLVSFSEAGSNFVFQSVDAHEIIRLEDGVPIPTPIIGAISPPLKTLAFWVLPTVIFFSALMALFYHYGVMQKVVAVMARAMQKTCGTSGAESLSAAANIFVGQTEAPLLVRPFIGTLTRSELNCIMTAGFATVAGGVMAIYVAIVPVPGIAGHLVAASIMSAPAALAVAKLLVPEDGQPTTMGRVDVPVDKIDKNGIDAIARGTLEGLQLYLNIIAMLLVFYAMITLVNAILGGIGDLVGLQLSLELILGYLFAPFALLMGVPWDECLQVGMLLGKKLTLTEIMAYLDLAEIQKSAAPLSERTAIIASYALCGFANFASIGIQIGGIGALAPERRGELARLGLRAMAGGTVAAMMTGAVAGIFV